MRLAISGPAGSGKTTAAEGVSKALGMELVLTGQMFRAMAEERGMTLADFGQLAKEDTSIDQEVDRRALAEFTEGRILEGRLAGALVKKNGIKAFTVYITASIEVRAQRISKREGDDPAEHMRAIQVRDQLDIHRYTDIYGIDPTDEDIYDLVIHADEMTPEEVVGIVVERYNEWVGGVK